MLAVCEEVTPVKPGVDRNYSASNLGANQANACSWPLNAVAHARPPTQSEFNQRYLSSYDHVIYSDKPYQALSVPPGSKLPLTENIFEVIVAVNPSICCEYPSTWRATNMPASFRVKF